MPTTRFILDADDVLRSSFWTAANLVSLRSGLTTVAVTSVAGRTGDVTLAIADVTSLQGALDAKAPLASPAFTSTPTAPTAAPGTNTTQLATTAFVFAGLALKAPLASPTFTGVPAGPTATLGTNTTQLATTAFVQAMKDALLNGAGGAYDTLKELQDLLVADESTAATLATLVGTKQAGHANLTAFSGLTLVADRLAYANGAGTLALATFTAFARTLLDDADAATMRATLGVGSLSLTATNVLVVDTAGNNSTGTRGRIDLPFLTINAACSAASSGDVIQVRPGTYTISTEISTAGITLDLAAGVTVSAPAAAFILAHYGKTILGDGVLEAATNFAGEAILDNGGSPMKVVARQLHNKATTLGVNTIAIYQSGAGPFDVRVEDLVVDDLLGLGIWWTGGDQHVTATRVSAARSVLVDSTVAAANGYLDSDEIVGAVTTGGVGGGDATAAYWVRTGILRPLAAATGVYATRAVEHYGANKLYVTAQKIFGQISTNTVSPLYLDVQKWEAVANEATYGIFLSTGILDVTGGPILARLGEMDPKSFTGWAMFIQAGTVTVTGMRLIGSSVMSGIKITGGTLRLVNCVIDTSLNSGTDALTVTGGTLELVDCTLVSEATKKDINQSGGTVKVVGGNGSGTKGQMRITGTVQFLDSESSLVLATPITASSDHVLALPGGTPVAGDRVKTYITASGADRNLKLNGAILVPSSSSFDNSVGMTMTSGKLYIVQLEYSGSAWMLTTIVGGY